MIAGRPSARDLRRESAPRRMLNLTEAALYYGVSPKVFAHQAKLGLAPQPKLIWTGRSQVRKWDLRELDEFADRLPSRDADGRPAAAPRRLLSF